MNDKDLVQIKLAFTMIAIGEWLNKNPNDNQDEGKGLIHKLKGESFASAKNQIENNADLKNASIIMIPYSVLKDSTPYNIGFLNFVNTAHPKAIQELGVAPSNVVFSEQDCKVKPVLVKMFEEVKNEK